jgi:hypothetical protein
LAPGLGVRGVLRGHGARLDQSEKADFGASAPPGVGRTGYIETGMTYDEARREVEQGVIGGKYTRTQARRLRAAIRVLERYDIPIPIWRQLEVLTLDADWAERLLDLRHIAEPLRRVRF